MSRWRKWELWLKRAAGCDFALFVSRKCFPGEKVKADYSCSSLQDLWRELHTVPSRKRTCSGFEATLPQIRLQKHVLEAFLAAAVSFCHMLRVAAAVVIVMVADELCFPSSRNRLLLASARPKFIQRCFKREEMLCLLLRSTFSSPFSSVNKDSVVRAKWKWRKG